MAIDCLVYYTSEFNIQKDEDLTLSQIILKKDVDIILRIILNWKYPVKRIF